MIQLEFQKLSSSTDYTASLSDCVDMNASNLDDQHDSHDEFDSAIESNIDLKMMSRPET
jgi:uncharacterized protein YpiB (UPF0302 family)